MIRYVIVLLVSFTLFLAKPAIAQNATFQVDATGTTPAIDSVIDAATAIWSWHLVSSVPIKVNVQYLNMTTLGPLAITFPNGRIDYSGTPKPGVWYPLSLVNAITGTDHSNGEYDMDIYVNSIKNWYTGLDGNPGASQHDMISVMLHEIGHGLGFASLAKVDSMGSFGHLTAGDYSPLTTSFPFPALNGKASIWDVYLQDGASILLTDTSNYPNPSNALATAFSGNNVTFSGPLATAEHTSPPRVHVAGAFQLGTSVTHLNEVSFPGAGPNSLMTPFIGTGQVTHDPGPVTLAILRDLGWMLATSPVNSASLPRSRLMQDRRNRSVTLLSDPGSIIQLYDLQGRFIEQIKNENGRLTFQLPRNIDVLIYRVIAQNSVYSGKIISID
jgi:hypothetical protein